MEFFPARAILRLLPGKLLREVSLYRFNDAVTAWFHTDFDFTVGKVNRKFQAYFDERRQPLLGRKVDDFLLRMGVAGPAVADFREQIARQGWARIPQLQVATPQGIRYFSRFANFSSLGRIKALSGLQGEFGDITREVLLTQQGEAQTRNLAGEVESRGEAIRGLQETTQEKDAQFRELVEISLLGILVHRDQKPIERARLLESLRKFRCRTPPCRVLVVEDDPPARELIRRTIEPEGWQVAEAVNGREALEKLAEKTPDVILLDLMMPEMDGFQLIDQLQNHEQWRAIPVVVVTSKVLSPQDLLRLNAHVGGIFQKGMYRKDELLNRVREMVVAQSG